jgi:hypothetical protein
MDGTKTPVVVQSIITHMHVLSSMAEHTPHAHSLQATTNPWLLLLLLLGLG